MLMHLVFDTGILSLGVFTNEDGIDIVVWRLETSYRDTWSDIGEQVECSTECQVQGDMSFPDCFTS